MATKALSDNKACTIGVIAKELANIAGLQNWSFIDMELAEDIGGLTQHKLDCLLGLVRCIASRQAHNEEQRQFGIAPEDVAPLY